jgi:hypothetical protein
MSGSQNADTPNTKMKILAPNRITPSGAPNCQYELLMNHLTNCKVKKFRLSLATLNV